MMKTKISDKLLYIDFETASDVELRGSDSVGLWNYTSHPSTRVLMLGWVINQEEVQLWFPDEPMPMRLQDALADPEYQIVAFNSCFERYVLQHVLKIVLPASRFQDPQASARYLSLPASLEDVSVILGLPEDKAKNKEGKRLIGIFCKPSKTRKKKGEEQRLYYRDKQSDPEDWASFCSYCAQDVIAEREVLRREALLGVWPLPPFEREIWELDQEINDRGMPVDISFVRNAYALGTKAKQAAIEMQNELTGLENANSNSQMLGWAKKQGYKPDSLSKEHVAAQLKFNEELTPLCREVLMNRKAAASTSYKKLETILRQASSDGRMRNLFSFMGSSRCGRFSSNTLQFHNFSRPDERFEDLETLNWARAMIHAEDYEAIESWFGKPTHEKADPGSVLTVIKSCIRTVFVAPEGFEFVVADENAIETRVAAWLANCESLLDVFKKGRDPYLDFAVKMTQIPYERLAEDIKSKDEAIKATAKRHRQVAKPGVLGCFGSNTKVLTDSGWKEIVNINSQDKLFDGVDWVGHGGVVYQGVKQVIDLNGIQVTPDHQILCEGEWQRAESINRSILLENQAISLAIGLLNVLNVEKEKFITFVSVGHVEKNILFLEAIWNSVKRVCAIPAVWSEFMMIKNLFLKTFQNILKTSFTDFPMYITPLYQDAQARGMLLTGTEVAESSVISQMSVTFSGILLHCQGLINQNYNWTVKKMTDIMKGGICVSSHPRLITETKRHLVGLNTRGKELQLRNFGKNMRPNIAASEMLPELYERVLQPSRLSQTSLDVEVPTYDILNCGPRNRFMIQSNKGPMIAHNCVYGLSGGEIKEKDGVPTKTGLWLYSENMGVLMDQKTAHEVVRVFRESYKEIVEYWYELEKAVKEVLDAKSNRVKRECGPLKIDKITIEGRDPILRIQLPSGRFLHYLDASVQPTKMPWKAKDEFGEDTVDVYRPTFVYSGVNQKTKQWTQVTSRGSKIFENGCQGIARDVLVWVLLHLKKIYGIPTCGHIHDEGVGLKQKDPFAPGLLEMENLMAQPVPWAPDLPLSGNGFVSDFYRKG